MKMISYLSKAKRKCCRYTREPAYMLWYKRTETLQDVFQPELKPFGMPRPHHDTPLIIFYYIMMHQCVLLPFNLHPDINIWKNKSVVYTQYIHSFCKTSKRVLFQCCNLIYCFVGNVLAHVTQCHLN